MLRLSKKADYALIALKDLASRADGRSSSARDIAERYDIPVELMAKVLQRLARNGLLASHQGTRGGYHLARPATAISMADVIDAIDGPVTVTACSTADDRCDQYSKCSVRDPLWRIKDRIVAELSAYTIFELVADAPPETLLPGTASNCSPVGLPLATTRADH
jgi:Rrf2 family protein